MTRHIKLAISLLPTDIPERLGELPFAQQQIQLATAHLLVAIAESLNSLDCALTNLSEIEHNRR